MLNYKITSTYKPIFIKLRTFFSLTVNYLKPVHDMQNEKIN